jgi:hypothetical protein
MTRGYKFRLPTIGVYGYSGSASEASEAMRIDWMRRDDISQAIPPVYTQWIGWWIRPQLT